MGGTRPSEKKGGNKSPPKGYPKDRGQYADPANYKYPIDTKSHANSAWSYINMPKNVKALRAEGYSSSEITYIRDRIKAAAKKHGIDIAQCEIKGLFNFNSEIEFANEDEDGIVKFGGVAVSAGVHNHIRITPDNLRLSAKNLIGKDVLPNHASSDPLKIAGTVISAQYDKDRDAITFEAQTNHLSVGKDLALLLKDEKITMGLSISSPAELITLDDEQEDGAWYATKKKTMGFDHLAPIRNLHQADKGAIVTVTFSEADTTPYKAEEESTTIVQEDTNMSDEPDQGGNLTVTLKEKEEEIATLKERMEKQEAEIKATKDAELATKKADLIDKALVAAKLAKVEVKKEELERLDLGSIQELTIEYYTTATKEASASEEVNLDDDDDTGEAPSDVNFEDLPSLWEA